MFLVTPLIIYPLWKRPKLGLVNCGVLAVASIAIQLILTAIYDWPPADHFGYVELL